MPSHQGRTRLMFLMMLMTSLRIHSIKKLTLGQVYDDNFNPVGSFLLQPEQNKGGKKALQVYLNDTLKQELKKYAKFCIPTNIFNLKWTFTYSNQIKALIYPNNRLFHIFRQIFDGVGLDKQYTVFIHWEQLALPKINERQLSPAINTTNFRA